MNPPPAPMFVLCNHIEAGFWCLIAIAMAIAALRSRGVIRHDCWIAALTLLVFGCSDWVEAITGAWWRPWWLLLWKGACLLVLLWLLLRHSQRCAAVAAGQNKIPARDEMDPLNPDQRI
jgi:hypothetical protein